METVASCRSEDIVALLFERPGIALSEQSRVSTKYFDDCLTRTLFSRAIFVTRRTIIKALIHFRLGSPGNTSIMSEYFGRE
jgi:hypothetical protein